MAEGLCANVFKSRHEGVDLAPLVRLGDADEEVVRASREVAREGEAAGDVVLGGEAAQEPFGFRRRADDELVESGRRVGELEAFERGELAARVGGLLRALRGHLL